MLEQRRKHSDNMSNFLLWRYPESDSDNASCCDKVLMVGVLCQLDLNLRFVTALNLGLVIGRHSVWTNKKREIQVKLMENAGRGLYNVCGWHFVYIYWDTNCEWQNTYSQLPWLLEMIIFPRQVWLAED